MDKTSSSILLITFFCTLCCEVAECELSPYVRAFEPLSYENSFREKRSSVMEDDDDDEDQEQQQQQHLSSCSFPISFFSHRRHFRLCLAPDSSVFHDDFRLLHSDGTENLMVHRPLLYHGYLRDEPGSECFGSIRDGVFDGQIRTKSGTYYVERAQKYFADTTQDGDGRKPSFHSIIYHEKELKDPLHHSRKGGQRSTTCGSDENREWMESVANSAIIDDDDPTSKEKDEETPDYYSMLKDDENPTFKYSAQANTRNGRRRVKRSLNNPNNRKSCSLYIQTDPLFWRHIKAQEKDDQKTEEEILSLIAQHVKAVNRIYSDTPFDGKYKHTGYQFEVQRIKIHNDSQCNSRDRDMNQFCIPNIDVSNFLNMHSKSNHEEFCLAYVFTYRDFTGGTLGLAWVASASGASGGICETYKRYTENINGVHHTAKRSLNTGIITFVNYNSPVPPKVSQLTLAHEIGHNFGSPHDYPEVCRPGGGNGNYIMFASATSGDLYNNNKFSNCSKSNISEVLDAIVDGRKPNCFTESDGAFCGNKIVEVGEECDCGFDEHECTEKCCYPRKSFALSEEENKMLRCTRRRHAECSPSQGPCCDNDCGFISRRMSVQCKGDDDCTEAAYCDGTQAPCPRPKFKPDNDTECNDGTQVCQAGECKDTICLKYGLASCFLTSDTVQDTRQLCELACLLPSSKGNQSSRCMSTTDLVMNGLMPELSNGLSLRPGSPCDNYQGYCDVFLKCRKVDAEGPLARLKNILFNEETLLTIAQWVTEYWWAVLLMSIGFVIFMALFIKFFAIHTPSSNPNMQKNLHFTDTLRRPVRSLQQKHYRRANSGHDVPPPPYPGNGSSSSQQRPPGGPGHGYGKGRGHYNRSMTPAASTPSGNDSARNDRAPARGRGASRTPASDRSSRIEMQYLR